MVNDLLDLAKMDKSNFNLDYEYFNMYEVVIEAFSIVSFQAQQKRINLFLLFDKSRPFVFKRIYNDKRRFLQIFLNFLSNSIKFTSFGGFIKIHLKIIEEQISDNSNLLNPSSKPSREETSREDSSVQSVMNELTFKKPNRTKSTLPVNLDQFN
jgi:signal transduction histidine kinase